MKKNNLYLDIHALQILPPSNVNRDDTGSPKTAQYGGATRARVSSQSWKRAIRQYFLDNADSRYVGIRSKDIPMYIAKKIMSIDTSKNEETSVKLACDILEIGGIKTANNKLKALFFMGDSTASNLAEAAINGVKDKKEIQNIIKMNEATDIALFGRMVADDPSLNEDASSQVAHAISTHAISSEFDFFTALDDLAPEDNAGAGMLGTVEFNSSTLYRYANVAVHEFSRQLKNNNDNVVNSLKLYIEAFVKSMPTGKVNTFANQTLPQFLMINIRKDRPINLVSAFEKPVKSNNGYMDGSIKSLLEELEKSNKFAEKALYTFILSRDELSETKDVKICDSLQRLLNDFEENIKACL